MSISYITYSDIAYGGHFSGSQYVYRKDSSIESLWDDNWFFVEWHDSTELTTGYSVISRLKSTRNDKFSITVDATGHICIKLVKYNGTEGRFIRSVVAPATTDKVGTYVKWDADRKQLYLYLFIESEESIKSTFIYNTASNTIVKYDIVNNYTGHIYTASRVDAFYSNEEIINMGNSGIVPVGDFNYMPNVFSEYGYTIKDKDNDLNIVGNSDVFEQNKWWYNDNPPPNSIVEFGGIEYKNLSSLSDPGVVGQMGIFGGVEFIYTENGWCLVSDPEAVVLLDEEGNILIEPDGSISVEY